MNAIALGINHLDVHHSFYQCRVAIVPWCFLTSYILAIVSFKEVAVILECQFVLVFRDNDSCIAFVFLMSYRVVKPLKDTLCVIFPYFGRDKRVLWIYFEPIVSYSIQ